MQLCEYGCGQEAHFQMKNNKWCCSKSWNSCPTNRSKNSGGLKGHPKTNNVASDKRICQYCGKCTNRLNIGKHERSCYMNPNNYRECPVCGNPIKSKDNQTCSNQCAGKKFVTCWPDAKLKNYRTICFRRHVRKCVICEEENLVQVHHLDENHTNDDLFNLIPLCPTHHNYMHSKFKSLIEEKVKHYIEDFKKVQNGIL